MKLDSNTDSIISLIVALCFLYKLLVWQVLKLLLHCGMTFHTMSTFLAMRALQLILRFL